MKAQADDNAALARQLAADGFAVFPCYPADEDGKHAKRPLSGVAWRTESTTAVPRIDAWWRRRPDALPAIDLGKSGMLVIDLDRHGGPDGVAAWSDLTKSHDPVEAPVVITPSTGQHVYFRNADPPHTNRRGTLPAGIDVRGNGGYVIAPGAYLPDGRSYELKGKLASAPAAPDWLRDILTAEKELKAAPQPARQPQNLQLDQTNDKRLDAYIQKAINAELQKVQNAPEGTRNNTLNEAAFSIGTMAGAGWISRAPMETALLNAAASCGLKTSEAQATVRSGLDAGMKNPREPLPEESQGDGRGADYARRLLQTDDGDQFDAETGEIIDQPQPAPAAQAMPDWHYPGGLLGAITDWILETTPRRPNRPLALAAAIGVIGTILGRTLAGPTRSGTHLYIAGVGDTGVGKDWPLRSVGMILDSCGLSNAHQAGKWKSDVALENAVAGQPGSIAIIDEIGQQLFAFIMGARSGAHQAGISVVLRELWGASFSQYKTSSAAGRKEQTVHSPAFSLFGVSTINEFYNSLSGRALDNGFFNRFLIIRAAPRAPARDMPPSSIEVPPMIRDRLTGLLRQGGNLESGAAALSMQRAPAFDVMPWASDDARDAYHKFDDELLARQDADPDSAMFLSRTAEMALRLATIHAASRVGRVAGLDMIDLQWGQAVAEASADIMINDVRERMAETEYEARSKLIERTIRERRRVSQRDLWRALRTKLPKRDFDAIAEGLAEAGVISKDIVQPAGGGRPSVWFAYQGN